MERTEQEVWQRVAAAHGAAPGDLEAALDHALWLCAAFRVLGSAELARREAASAACLRGMLWILGRPAGERRRLELGREPRRRLLNQCVRRCREAQMIYASRLADPDFGAAFQILSQREQEQLTQTLELLGQ